MADISQVEQALVDIAAASLGLGDSYLDGALGVTPAAGTPCRVYRGWPVSGKLNDDLSRGISNISVFPPPGATRNMTRHFYQWHVPAPVTPTLLATVAGNTVTFDGTGSAGQVAGVRFGPDTGQAYAYRLTATDTPFTVASELSSRIPGSTADGNVLTAPTDYGLQARIAADQPAFMETRRQEQQIWVIGWCPNPHARDQIMSAIDAGFANLMDAFGRPTIQFPLSDGSVAIIRYQGSRTDDAPQQANLWRRDLRYRIEYATTLLQQQPEVLFIGEHLYNDVSFEVSIGDLLTSAPQDDQTLRAAGGPITDAALAVTQMDQALSNVAALNVTQDDDALAHLFSIGVDRIGIDYIA
jgi:hypothetical protein